VRSPITPPISGGSIYPENSDDALDLSILEGMRTGLGDSLFFDLLAKLVPIIDQYAMDLSVARREQSLQAAKEVAHSIKGVALQFGAKEIASLAAAIEHESQTIEEVTHLAERLLNAIPDLKRALQNYTQRSAA